jgi:phosphatidylglycerophosphate synthase
LTADRLSDHRFLQTFAAAGSNGDADAVIAVDLKSSDDGSPTEKRYTPNDGKALNHAEAEAATVAREVGIYLFPASAVAEFTSGDIDYLSERANDYVKSGNAGYFDIGNGFVQPIDSPQAVRSAGDRLIRYIWKSTDGIHARANKRIVLPLLKVLLRTPVTPNMVSLVGVIISIFSGYFYARGQYIAAVIGGLLGIAAALLDHVDGSIARIKSKESAFGAHFDTICDYVFYFSFGLGATVGMYRATDNPFYIWLGIALLFGVLISLLTTSYQRTAFASNASTYAAEAHQKFANSQNKIVRLGKKVYFVARRPALPFYLLFFTVVGALPFVLFMTALGCNLFWMFHVYTNKFYTPQTKKLN